MDKTQKSNTDVAAEVKAKLQEYFHRFDDEDDEGIIENVYAIPINIGLESGVRVLFMNADDVRRGLAYLRKQTEEEGWIESPIINVNTHVLTDGLVFADLTYQRRKTSDPPETSDVSIIYVLQNLKNKGWRITSFYIRDPDKALIAKS